MGRAVISSRERVVVLALVLVGGVPAAGAAQGLPRLLDAPWMGFDTGVFPDAFGPGSMAAGDLDLDGDQDVVVGQDYFAGPGISVLLNHGNGTFARPRHHPLPWNDAVGRVRLVDVDRDDDLDVVATLPDVWGQSSDVGVWWNDGTGALTGPVRFSTGPGPVGLVVADFNLDGFPDLVTGDQGRGGQGSTVTVLLHNGLTGPGAGFLAGRAVSVGSAPYGLDAGDIDGDLDVDLAVAHAGSPAFQISILRNDGSAGFGAPELYTGSSRAIPLVRLVDFDLDGDLDMVSSSFYEGGTVWNGEIVLRRNDGTGSFGVPTTYAQDGHSPWPGDMACGDLTGSGYPDVVTTNPDGRSTEGWRLHRNDHGERFEPVQDFPQSQNSQAVELFDADGDGDLDVATLGHHSAELTIHLNRGYGFFLRLKDYPVAGFHRGMDGGDIDGDGDRDVISVASKIEILRNNGNGTFAPVETYTPSRQPAAARLADLDGDGDLDLLMHDGQSILVGKNPGSGVFQPDSSFPLSQSCGGGSLAALDIDGDRDLDAVLSGCPQGFNSYLLLSKNDGTGSFTAMPRVQTYVTTRGIAGADLNKDGKLDLVTNESGFGLGVFLGHGDFTFEPEIRHDVPVYLFALADFDRDGFTDAGVLVSAGAFGTDEVGFCRGLGDGRFDAPVLYTTSSVLENLRVGTQLDAVDLSCDDVPDLVVTNYASNDLSVLVNRGDGTFEPQVRYGVGWTPQYTVFGDFNGDGTIDVVTDSELLAPCCSGAVVMIPGLCGCAVPDIIPPDQGNVLMAVKRTGDVEVKWRGTRAQHWRLYRDDAKRQIGRTPYPPDLVVELALDRGGIGGEPRYYYRVRGLSPCSFTPGP